MLYWYNWGPRPYYLMHDGSSQHAFSNLLANLNMNYAMTKNQYQLSSWACGSTSNDLKVGNTKATIKRMLVKHLKLLYGKNKEDIVRITIITLWITVNPHDTG